MKEILVRALERLLDFTNWPQRYDRNDGSFDYTSALRDWRRIRAEARVALMAAMEELE